MNHQRDETRRSPSRHTGGTAHAAGLGHTNLRNFHGSSEVALFIAAGVVFVKALWQFSVLCLRAYQARRARKMQAS